ncbi:MAG TPA: SDR family NAD(P)-dependent oxidoreductase [Ignavibacteriaceae bacterium]|nr:SDR family NAD(P)-dependent oxidoreductase [Ignavibacteriaceae bacterium]
MEDFKNKYAFITGTSSGIGLAIAEALLEKGWIVSGASRRDSPIKNENYNHINIDLSDISSFKDSLSDYLNEQFKKNYKRILLVNNAAVTGKPATLDNYEPEELHKIFVVNSVVPAWLMGFFIKNHKPGSELQIINISSGAAKHTIAGLSAYCSSKAALRMAGQVAISEINAKKDQVDSKISVLSYEPSVVETDMQVQARNASQDEFPSSGMFRNFKESGMLTTPGKVAEELTDLIERGLRPGFSEKRFGS